MFIRRASFIPISLGIGFILSPEIFVLLSNNLGRAGMFFFGAIPLAAIAYILTAISISRGSAAFSGAGNQHRIIKEALGPGPATVLPFISRVFFAVCVSPIILSRAGFIFNEVFLYWFPNFLFAFLLLAFIAAVNAINRRLAQLLQPVFVAIVVSGLMIFYLAGFVHWGEIPSHDLSIPEPLGRLQFTVLALLLFVGFDLSTFQSDGNTPHDFKPLHSMLITIIGSGILFCLWSVLSLGYVPMDKLAESTVPYMVVARKIMGQPGRILMGITLIAGACSVMNAMYLCLSEMMMQMAREGLLPGFIVRFKWGRLIPLLLLAGGGAVLMGIGMAGEPQLAVYARAGLVFWLLHYAAVHLAVILLTRRKDVFIAGDTGSKSLLISIAGLAIFLTGFIVIGIMDKELRQITTIMMIVFAAGSIGIWLTQLISRRGDLNDK